MGGTADEVRKWRRVRSWLRERTIRAYVRDYERALRRALGRDPDKATRDRVRALHKRVLEELRNSE